MGKGSRNRELRITENQASADSGVKLSRKQLIRQQEQKERTKRYITMAASIVILVGLIVAIVVVTLNKTPKLESTVSATSGEYEIDNSMMAYFMYSQYQSFVQQNYYYLSMYGLDPNKPLKNQTMAGGTTSWYVYFMNSAKAQVNELVALASEAQKKEYKLDEKELKAIDETMASIASSAKANGYPSVNKYLAASYVSGVTESAVRRCLELQYLASKYYTDLLESYEYTEKEIEKYVEDNPDQFYKFDYIYYTFNAEYDQDASDAEKKEALAEAKRKAEALLEKITDDKTFRELINEMEKAKKEEDKDEKKADSESGTGSSSSSEKDYSESFVTEGGRYSKDDEFSAWAFKDERKEGDKTIIERKDSKDNATGYTVYLLQKPAYKDEYMTQNVRHILFSTSTYGSKDKAKAEAEKILAEYKKGEMTEDAFAELAKKYSEDGNAEDGGIYEDVFKDQMVEEFNDWIYDEDRKTGDVEIVQTSYGAHIMFYVGEGRQAWKVNSENGLKSEQYEEELKELEKTYPVVYDDKKLTQIP